MYSRYCFANKEIQLQLKTMFDVLGIQGYKLHKLITTVDDAVKIV